MSTTEEPSQRNVENLSQTDWRKKCPPFGVRSYLNNFYNSGKEGTIFEDPSEEYSYLLKPKKNRSRYCKPILWKAAIWIGINFLIFGLVGILVAYLVPKKIVYVASEKNKFIVNDQAKSFNNNLDVVKLVGLLLFCLGGVLTIVGLLIPTILWKHCFETQRVAEQSGSDAKKSSSIGGTKMSVETTPGVISTTLDKVQPERVENESILPDADVTASQ